MTLPELFTKLPCLKNCKAHVKYENHQRVLETWEEHTSLCMQYFHVLYQEKQVGAFLKRLLDDLLPVRSQRFEHSFCQMFADTVLFHDVGKLNVRFQTEKLHVAYEIPFDYDFAAYGSQHSELSAFYYLDTYWNVDGTVSEKEQFWLQYFAILFAYVISRHHGELSSCKKFVMEKLVCQSNTFAHLQINLDAKSIRNFFVRSKKQITNQQSMSINAVVRMCESLLVTSDFYATCEFMQNVEMTDFGHFTNVEEYRRVYESTDLMKSVRQYQRGNPKTMNDLRTEIFLESEEQLEQHADSSVFYLKAPTGSGKSNNALNLSLHLLEQDKSLQKLFYVYPFNTLVEQNDVTIRTAFCNDETLCSQMFVVNSLTPIHFAEEEGSYQKSLLDRQFCNYPLVITTHVQLFDMLFGDKRESVFGFHQLMNSVIVLDEIQFYKQSIWTEIAWFMKIFGRLLNMKFIVMSATLPNFDQLTEDVCDTVHLLNHADVYFQHELFRNRVVVHYDLLDYKSDEVLSEMLNHMGQFVLANQKIMVEFMTKTDAYHFYRDCVELYGDTCDVELMTGEDNRVTRNRIIEKVKTCSDGLILIATQVVEAGVDISVDIGYKAISKLDSEEQFMGRINRSAVPGKMGHVWFFRQGNVKRLYREDIRISDEFTLDDKKMQTVLQEKNFDMYYQNILQRLQCRNGLYGSKGLQYFWDMLKNVALDELAKHMALITAEDWTRSVYLAQDVVLTNGTVCNGVQVWNEYRQLVEDPTLDYAKKTVLLSEVRSKMSYFTVNLPKKWVEQMIQDGAIEYGEMVYVEHGDKYFEDGKLNRALFESNPDAYATLIL